MSVEVKFVNKSGERVFLYQEDGSILKIMENGKCWDRPRSGGSLRTTVISQHESPPPPQPEPRWVDKVEWIYETCPDGSPYAPYKTITFADGNRVKLRKRLFWKLPEMKWPVVTFLFTSDKMKMIRERLEFGSSAMASIFLNGIPQRQTVHALSKYVEYKRWFFIEQPVKKSSDRQMDSTEIVQHGEILRSSTELKRIEKLKEEEEERKLV